MTETVIGYNVLNKQFDELEAAAQARILRSAIGFAATPVLTATKAQAPVSRKGFKTYKGRFVAPGFLKRSLKKVTRKSRNGSRAYAFIWAEPEAFYGFQFVIPGARGRPPNDFATRGYRASRDQVPIRFGKKINERIAKVTAMSKN